MKLELTDVRKLVELGTVKISDLGNRKGSTAVVHNGKLLYVWKNDDSLLLQSKWFWGKKYSFPFSEVQI